MASTATEEPFVHISNRKACIAFAEKTINKYHNKISQTNLEPELAQPCTKKAKRKVPCEDEDFASFMSASQLNYPEESTSTSNTSALTREMARYIHIATQPLKGNPLDWWRDERKQFPELAKVARLVLAVSASSAPTERVFSKLGRVCAKERAHMKPQMADALTFWLVINVGNKSCLPCCIIEFVNCYSRFNYIGHS